MAGKVTEWPSKRGPITKIMLPDGVKGDTVPLAVGRWYVFQEFGCHLGNVGLRKAAMHDLCTKLLPKLVAGFVLGNIFLGPSTALARDEALKAMPWLDDLTRPVPQNHPVPQNQFNVGDSIGEGEAADDTIGAVNHQTVWSTGFEAADIVDSVNERFEATNSTGYFENDSARDAMFNRARSGADMADFAIQAQEVVAEASMTPSGDAGMVTILLGNNDVCADTLDTMTDPSQFEAQFRAGLDVLAASPLTSSADIHVSSIPAIYWLWNAKRNDLFCRVIAWRFVPCQNLLSSPGDDCESTASRLDPDTISAGDGPNCTRRKEFHAKIRDVYNPILRDVLAEYQSSGVPPKLPNAEFIDIFDVPFDSRHINDGDCFHPSVEGHALLAEKQWCRSKWGVGDIMCLPKPKAMPWLYLLLGEE